MKGFIIAVLVATHLMGTPAQAVAPRPSKTALLIHTATPAWNRAFAKQTVDDFGYAKNQWRCLNDLWTKESNFRHKARNTIPVYQGGKKLHAFGIAQVLGERAKDPRIQIIKGMRYIQHRYGSPCRAWNFWQRHYWY